MSEHYRICPICEAACGLRISADGRQVLEVRANREDVFSEGHVCAKGIALTELDADPDRLRTPLIRRNGDLHEASWHDAYEFVAQRLQQVRDAHGAHAIASYIGNPTAHNVGLSMGLGVFAQALGSPHVYSAGTVDQVPKQLACELLFGNDMAVPVPDILHCDYLLMLGANPVVSNGSLWMVPKIREKVRALKARGGKLVTVDPRRSETARLADAHHFIRPGTDAWFLIALIHLVRKQRNQLASYPVKGADEMLRSLEQVSVAEAAERSGVDVSAIEEIASQLVSAERPVIYGRVGTTLQQFGTLTSFLVEVLNLTLGALDREGGAMFPEQPYHDTVDRSGSIKLGRFHSRVSGYPEVLGQLPVAALAEEILTPGDGQVRALFCFAGNPLVSNPDSERLRRALSDLDLLVCVDIYHTETSQLADVVLPGTSPFEDGHYDHFLGAMGFRNVARYSAPVFAPSQPDEWDIGLALACTAIHGRAPRSADLEELEDSVVAGSVSRLVADETSGIAGADVQQIMAAIEPERGVERLLDLGIRAGRYGDHFGAREGLRLNSLIEHPEGIDLGQIRAERLAEVMGHRDQQIDLAPEVMLSEVRRLQDTPAEPDGSLYLIGRRSTRMNNSWLRNLKPLVDGRPLCTLQIHPHDVARFELEDGCEATVRSSTGTVRALVEVSEHLMPGVVSLPHGFSDTLGLSQANLKQGANYNVLAAADLVDVPSGTAALNGIRVEVARS